MKPRLVPLIIVALALFALLAGYAVNRSPSPAYATNTASANTVDFNGVGDVRLGQRDTDLTRQGALSHPAAACGPTLTATSAANPVFADGRLVLLWVHPPLTTPEGIGEGTPLTTARATYPRATAMTAPAGSYQFDGLLVTSGDRAYLFMHDGQTVRKVVVGFTAPAERLFTHGIGNC
ncbi:hypothetical protein DFJ67_2513 [Asanoa ferruginea]|uniref:Uncharacterized protein n=1 Tax=Asanoa ferruginea TaxID=53367 RepID=A0A3D9ZS79_9ACTN|nr:hypothetical protein [Asanoa ferruginea]REF96530.1 hypothetical protein DFJ67_2513 [Asanoa ferruginea]GIF53598.1 hypothetical protein Afe04nite_81370 [Asanoa ferruginea]